MRRAAYTASSLLLVASLLTLSARAEPLEITASAMITIPAGSFVRGSTQQNLRDAQLLCVRVAGEEARACYGPRFLEETPSRRIHLGAYRIDRTEVTQRSYARCVAAGRCAPSATHARDARFVGDALPVTGVRFADARAHCAFMGGRLPSEAEWERAARGDEDDRLFPWGSVFEERYANHGGGRWRGGDEDGARYLAPVASYPEGRSPFGLHDMAGNVWEWTDDVFELDAYEHGLGVSPRSGAGGGGFRVVRGGSYESSPLSLRVTTRVPVPEGEHGPYLGFRCAYDPRRE